MFGTMLTQAVKDQGINIDNLVTDDTVHTTLAFVHTGVDGDRDFSFYRNPGADMMLREEEIQQEIFADTKILKEEIGWNRNTTYTVIKKCIEKGAVERFEPKFRCRALISKKDAQEYETEELIDRMFEGSKKNFFAAMLSENSLTAEELEQLKDMVNQMK